jgi:hypothetical protein
MTRLIGGLCLAVDLYMVSSVWSLMMLHMMRALMNGVSRGGMVRSALVVCQTVDMVSRGLRLRMRLVMAGMAQAIERFTCMGAVTPPVDDQAVFVWMLLTHKF